MLDAPSRTSGQTASGLLRREAQEAAAGCSCVGCGEIAHAPVEFAAMGASCSRTRRTFARSRCSIERIRFTDYWDNQKLEQSEWPNENDSHADRSARTLHSMLARYHRRPLEWRNRLIRNFCFLLI
jgi:hypothetical protein